MMNNKIVKIIDEYTVIINAGTNKGIEIGDKLQIIDEKGSEVKDPDTNEVLGFLDLIKDTVEVSEVHDKMCICVTPHYTTVNNIISPGLRSIAGSIVFSEQKKLNVDLSQVTGGLRKSDAPIQIGDPVRIIKSSKKQTKE